jgi:hypothetical protein
MQTHGLLSRNVFASGRLTCKTYMDSFCGDGCPQMLDLPKGISICTLLGIRTHPSMSDTFLYRTKLCRAIFGKGYDENEKITKGAVVKLDGSNTTVSEVQGEATT